jgi:uncharacterized SAM-binding protein YcdF (DUF218 family)
MKMTQHKKSTGWIVVLIVVVTLLLFSKPLLRSIGNFLIVKNSLAQVDLITASSGPSYRIIYAADLYKQGLAPRLFYTGGYNEFDSRYEASWSKYLATTEGVPPEAIYTDDTTVTSTYQEAVRLKEFIDAHPGEINSIIIVTDAYHTRRAQWAYHKVLGSGVKILMAPVPFDKAGYTQNWWSNAISRKMVPEEYFKYAFYLLRYQFSSGPLQKFLSKFDKF